MPDHHASAHAQWRCPSCWGDHYEAWWYFGLQVLAETAENVANDYERVRRLWPAS